MQDRSCVKVPHNLPMQELSDPPDTKNSAAGADVVTLGDAWLGPAIRQGLVQPLPYAGVEFCVSLRPEMCVEKCGGETKTPYYKCRQVLPRAKLSFSAQE